MSHQFKPGDLAIIISTGPRCQQILGKVVEVVAVDLPVIDEYPICIRGEGLIGLCQLTDEVIPVVTNWCRPTQLMPLRNDHLPKRKKQKVVPT